jgi:acyl carrier protein
MVPSSFFFLDDLPLTPNGKVDRKALARLGAGASAEGRAHVAPRTPNETLIADLWRDALKVDKVGVRDNFFDLGGHSLLAMRVLAAIEERTGHRFHPRDIIFQTLEQLAAACAAAPEASPVPEPPGKLRRLFGALRGRVAPGGSDPGA